MVKILYHTCLQVAVLGKKEKIVQLLLRAGANPNEIFGDWGTALQLAAVQGNELIVKLLLEANADVNLRCKGDFDPVRPWEKNQFKLLAN